MIAKADEGKLNLTLVPRQIIWDIAEVREYGNKKYHSPDNWKNVEVERYRAAAFRHFLAYLDDPHGVDEESGIEHYKHLCCNLAFICEMETPTLKNDPTLGEEHDLVCNTGDSNGNRVGCIRYYSDNKRQEE